MIRRMLEEIVENRTAHKNVGVNAGTNVGINVQKMSLEEKILILLKDNPKMTSKQLALILGMSVRQIEKKLHHLSQRES